jgi:anti-anti-sigma factor
MVRLNESLAVAHVNDSQASSTVVRGPCAQKVCVIYLAGAFRAPLDGELRHKVHDLLCQGVQKIVLDLAGVSRIDAAGVGQLVRAYNMTVAAHRVLQIVHATPWVREILERFRLFEILSAERSDDVLQ